jgi:predicted ArsR family transcriptional regulator
MVDLFGRDLSVVARHIQNVFAEGELDREASLQILQTSPAAMGRPATLYNLGVVIDPPQC